MSQGAKKDRAIVFLIKTLLLGSVLKVGGKKSVTYTLQYHKTLLVVVDLKINFK